MHTHSIRGAHFLCATLYYEIEAWGEKSEAVDRAGLEERMVELQWIIPIKFIPWTRVTPERRKSSEIVQKTQEQLFKNYKKPLGDFTLLMWFGKQEHLWIFWAGLFFGLDTAKDAPSTKHSLLRDAVKKVTL